jgi:hypothetical protein
VCSAPWGRKREKWNARRELGGDKKADGEGLEAVGRHCNRVVAPAVCHVCRWCLTMGRDADRWAKWHGRREVASDRWDHKVGRASWQWGMEMRGGPGHKVFFGKF